MRHVGLIALGFVTAGLSASAAFAGSPAQVYARYAASNSPYSQAVHADAAAEALATEADPHAVGTPGTRWNPTERVAPATGVVDCATHSLIDHPLGPHVARDLITEACQKMGEGDLVALDHTGRWPDSGAQAVQTLVVAVKVPGKNQVVLSAQPWRDAGGAAAELNAMFKGQRPERARRKK
ncbi:MAG: hypothetical protein ACE366_23160 [Bradymonadia bacterium]